MQVIRSLCKLHEITFLSDSAHLQAAQIHDNFADGPFFNSQHAHFNHPCFSTNPSDSRILGASAKSSLRPSVSTSMTFCGGYNCERCFCGDVVRFSDSKRAEGFFGPPDIFRRYFTIHRWGASDDQALWFEVEGSGKVVRYVVDCVVRFFHANAFQDLYTTHCQAIRQVTSEKKISVWW